MITALVPVPSTARPGDVLTVVGNFGDALSSPGVLNKRRVPALPAGLRRASHKRGTFKSAAHKDANPGGGHKQQIFKASAHKQPPRVVPVELRDVYGWGDLAVAIVPRDAAGQDKGTTPTASVIFCAEPPLAPKRFAFNSYDAGDGTVTFDLEHGAA